MSIYLQHYLLHDAFLNKINNLSIFQLTIFANQKLGDKKIKQPEAIYLENSRPILDKLANWFDVLTYSKYLTFFCQAYI